MPEQPLDPSQVDNDFPSEGRLAAVDFGSVRIGVAICDPDRILSSPLTVIPADEWELNPEAFRQLAEDESIKAWIVGLPIHLDGGESDSSQEARRFAGWLSVATDLPVRLFDERFTTVEAGAKFLGTGMTSKKRKKRIDAVAALVLLESFLEAWRFGAEIPGQAAIVDRSSFEISSANRSSASRRR
ncbi:MAG: Holliday junction resolvase RuvX [Planctomycetota bacterium]